MIKHGGFLSSSGVGGWYTTQEEDEVIEFKYPLNSLMIETLGEGVEIQINGTKDNLVDKNLWIIDGNDKEGLDGLTVRTIVVRGVEGQQIRWKGLIA